MGDKACPRTGLPGAAGSGQAFTRIGCPLRLEAALAARAWDEAPSPAGNSGAAILELFQSLPVFSDFILRGLSDPKPQRLSKQGWQSCVPRASLRHRTARVSREDAGRSSYDRHWDWHGKIGTPKWLSRGWFDLRGKAGIRETTKDGEPSAHWERKLWLPLGLSKRRRDRETDHLTEHGPPQPVWDAVGPGRHRDTFPISLFSCPPISCWC